ncbi:MAG: hypothetical protein COC14_00050 [Burkholderiaceae bacterium]|nr:MAG: hypothetical protein COC14_00050 [Burkholderiaceae bacterium]
MAILYAESLKIFLAEVINDLLFEFLIRQIFLTLNMHGVGLMCRQRQGIARSVVLRKLKNL